MYSDNIERGCEKGQEGKRNTEVMDNKYCYQTEEEVRKMEENGEGTMEEEYNQRRKGRETMESIYSKKNDKDKNKTVSKVTGSTKLRDEREG